MADQAVITTETWEMGGLTSGTTYTTYTCPIGSCRDVPDAVYARMLERQDWGLLSLTESEPQWAEGQQYTCHAVTAETQGWVMNSAFELIGVLTVVTIVVVSIIVICKAIGNTFTLLERHEQLRDTLNDQISDLSAKLDQFMNAKKGTKP